MSLERTNRNRTMAEDRLHGYTYSELSKKYGLAKSTIYSALNNEQIKEIIEVGQREMVSMAPIAVDNYRQLLRSEDEKIRLQASKEVLQTAGIVQSHTPSAIYMQVNAAGDVHITAELSDMQAYLASRWAKAQGGSCTRNRTEEISSCNDSDYVDAEIVYAPKNAPKSESNEGDTRG